MKFAFLLLTHKAPDALFMRLLEFLSQFKSSKIILHHDYSQSVFDPAIIKEFNIQMVTPHIKTQWGHISKINAIAEVYKKAFEVIPDFDWIITLSANCFPIKSKNHILEFFKKAEYDYYMETHELGYQYEGIYKWHYKTLFTDYITSIPILSKQFKLYKRAIRLPKNKAKTPFKNLIPYTGSDWYFVNNKSAKFIVESDLASHPITKFIAKQNLAPDMNASPDEIIIQTLLRNNTDLRGCNNNFRYIDWSNSKNWHPNTLTEKDWSEIQKSKALFGRKFDDIKSSSLLSKICLNFHIK